MVRVKRGNVARNRRNKILKIAKGFRGTHSKLFRMANQHATIIGLLAVLGLNISEFGSTESYYGNMIVESKFSSAFSSLFIVLTIFLVALGHNFYENHQK